MSNLHPSIENILRSHRNVGSENIQHAHHQPLVRMQSGAEHDSTSATAPEETTPNASLAPQLLREKIGRAANYLANVFSRGELPDERTS